MEYFCTPCCKRKRRDRASLPARERYLSRRIRHVLGEGERRRRPVLILSGRYGLLAPDDPIPWYDHLLTSSEVKELASTVVTQLVERRVDRLVFFARPRRTAGWRPYFDVCEEACRRAGVGFAVQLLGSEYI